MKPAWDALGAASDGDAAVAIADVDCTTESTLCQAAGVRGYPTIKYWKGGAAAAAGDWGEKYTGGRDEATLKAFVAENK